VNVLSDVLIRLCERHDLLTMNQCPVTRFHALRAPRTPIKSYLERITRYTKCSEECLVLALIYIDRLIKNNGDFLVVSLNVHRLMLTSIMVSAKFFDDQQCNNAYFGKLGGVSCKEIDLIEIEFLFVLNFNLCVEIEIFMRYSTLLRKISQSGGKFQQNKGVVTMESTAVPFSALETEKPSQESEQPTFKQ